MRDGANGRGGLAALRILVAGGAGFRGSNLCDRLLEHGHQVVCLDNFLTGCVENLESARQHPAFEPFGADIVDPLPARLRLRPLETGLRVTIDWFERERRIPSGRANEDRHESLPA